MPSQRYRYTFVPDVSLDDVRASLLLATLAVESLHGESQTRLDALHALDALLRTCVIDAATPVGRDLNRVFVGFLRREFRPDQFTVERMQRVDGDAREATV